MIKNSIFAAGLLVLFAQCKEDELPACNQCGFTCLDVTETTIFTNDCNDNWVCSYQLFDNASIKYTNEEFDGAATVLPGSYLVFKTTLATQGQPLIIDDEVTYTLFFEIDPAKESFSAEGEQLKQLNLRYQAYCYCVDTHFKKPSGGCMQGERIDDKHWRVQAKLTIGDSFGMPELLIDAVYELD